MDLASGDAFFLGVRDAVDGERARSANSLAAVVIEMDRIVAFIDDLLIDDIQPLVGYFRQRRCGYYLLLVVRFGAKLLE
jgi:hypothetical protein